jgi:archaellum component FlaC
LFGDAKNNEVAKHRAYLEQYDQEIKKLTDKKAVEELDRNLRELRDQEKECLSSIIRDLESKFKEIERHGIDVVCKPPPPPPEPATEPQKQ